MNQTEVASATSGEALIERVVASTIGLFDLAGLYLGQRLGLYRALHDGGSATSEALAHRPASMSAMRASGWSTRP